MIQEIATTSKNQVSQWRLKVPSPLLGEGEDEGGSLEWNPGELLNKNDLKKRSSIFRIEREFKLFISFILWWKEIRR